jgi:hypothetical protein
LTASASANVRTGGKSVESDPGAFLPRLESWRSVEEWAVSAKSAGVAATDAPKSVARLCALANLRLQGAALYQQTHGLVPFG